MNDFERALALVLKSEGGYVDDPNDSGGQTIFGITRRDWPRLTFWQVIDDMLSNNRVLTDMVRKNIEKTISGDKKYMAEIASAYRKGYWDKSWCDQMPWPLNYFVFDFAVNSGAKTAIKYLQELVGTPADGLVGKKTIAAVRAYKGSWAKYLDRREQYYYRLVATQPKNQKFYNGWINRLNELRKLV